MSIRRKAFSRLLEWFESQDHTEYSGDHPIALARQALDETSLSQAIVECQASDDGLWFAAETAAEAYLQQELRKLHTAIENED